jgi:DNA topoisomerase-2
MVLFNDKNKIKKYTIDEILHEFCRLRYDLYEIRRNKMMEVLKANMKHISNKVRFVTEIIEEKFDIMNVPEMDVIKKLIERNYDREVSEKNEDVEEKGFDYLLKMNVRSFTKEKVDAMTKELRSLEDTFKEVENTNAKTMWLNDLNDFSTEYSKWLKVIDKVENKKKV